MRSSTRRAMKRRIRGARVARIPSLIAVAVERDLSSGEPQVLTVFRGRRRAMSIQLAPGMGALIAQMLSPEAIPS